MDTDCAVGERLAADPTARAREQEPASPPGSARTALRAVIGPFWASRLVVLLSGIYASVKIGTHGVRLTSFGTLLTAPSRHWDSGWYVYVADAGYRNPVSRAFFPLYPLLLKGIAYVTGDFYTAGVVVSLAAFLVAVFLLYRLVELDFGSEVASITVALVAFCPVAFFFSAIYTESLFLALSVGAVYAARCERWLLAGIVGALASATRNTGVLLVLPIALLYLYGPRGNVAAAPSRWHETRRGMRRLLPRYRIGWPLWSVLLVPLGVLAFTLYLVLAYHAGTSWITVQEAWGRHSTTPINGLLQGVKAGWSGLRDLISHPGHRKTANSPDTTNIVNVIACLAGLAVLVGCVRTLPAVYWVYAGAAFLVPLASPLVDYPLNSFPRFELVIFPLFICAARYLVRRRWTTVAVASSAVLLGMFATAFAAGAWVA